MTSRDARPRTLAGQTRVLCGIVLHPAGHTRSPAMHVAAYRALGIAGDYHAFDVPPESLADAIRGIRALGVAQVAVSIPHKESVIPYLDRVDETARTIGAVNTVTRIGADLVGSNTDWLGAIRALQRGIELAGRRAVVLGAGGAARAVVYGLVRAGCEVCVLNRDVARAEALVAALRASRAGPLEALASLPHSVLVNTTSVGLRADASPVDAAHLRPDSVVMDAVYDPEHTRLLRDAKARGATPISGKWMLVHQAAEQLRIWSGLEAPINVMEEAFDRAGRTDDH